MAIPNPTKCEVCSVIQFLDEKEAPADFHCQFVSVYGELLFHETVKERLDNNKLVIKYVI